MYVRKRYERDREMGGGREREKENAALLWKATMNLGLQHWLRVSRVSLHSHRRDWFLPSLGLGMLEGEREIDDQIVLPLSTV